MQNEPSQKTPDTEVPNTEAPHTQKDLANEDLQKHFSFLERLEASPFYEKIMSAQKNIGYLVLCFVLTLILISTLVSRSKQNKINDAQLANLYAKELKKTAKIFEEEPSLDREQAHSQKEQRDALIKIANSDPQVKALYAGLLAEELFLSGDPQATPLAEQAINMLKKNQLDLFANFSEITLLTSQNLLKEALEKTHQLIEQKELQELPALFACTSLQKQNLEKALGFLENSEKTKEKLRAFLKTQDPSTQKNLQLLFKDGERSIIESNSNLEK